MQIGNLNTISYPANKNIKKVSNFVLEKPKKCSKNVGNTIRNSKYVKNIIRRMSKCVKNKY